MDVTRSHLGLRFSSNSSLTFPAVAMKLSKLQDVSLYLYFAGQDVTGQTTDNLYLNVVTS